MKNWVIAEAGSNHNGDAQRAVELIGIAKSAKADSVKFQFIFADGLYLPAYWEGGTLRESPVYNQRATEELTEQEWQAIWRYAAQQKIDISASVFCMRGLKLLERLGASYVKIASTDLTNLYLIDAACGSFQRVILSTGMATIEEVSRSVRHVRKRHPDVDLKLMHCVSVYPCALGDAKIARIEALRHAFGLEVGYSDHTADERSAILAWSKGAAFFEKHFTYDKSAPGFDHAHALNPTELRHYVSTIGSCEAALAWTEHSGGDAEDVTRLRARRGVYVSHDLPKGHVISEDDILFVRPSSEYQTFDPREFIGREVRQDLRKYTAIGMDTIVAEVASNTDAANKYWNDEMKNKKMADS